MAAPKRNRMKEGHQPTIDKARTTQLVKRLISFALNEDEKSVNKDKGTPGKKVEMSSTQVTAALGIIKKVIPDLSATELSGPDGGPMEQITKIERVIVKPKD